MRTYENRHPNEQWLMWKLGNWTAIDRDWIRSIGFAWLFKRDGKWDFLPLIGTADKGATHEPT